MEKNTNPVTNKVMIFIGIAILLAGMFISNGLDDVSNSDNDGIYYQDDDYEKESFELIVQDGTMYMWETTSGEVWKKPDTKEGKWEEVDSLSDFIWGDEDDY